MLLSLSSSLPLSLKRKKIFFKKLIASTRQASRLAGGGFGAAHLLSWGGRTRAEVGFARCDGCSSVEKG